MNVLLDTNCLIWLLNSTSQKKLGRAAQQLIQTAETIYVSSISIFEIRAKSMLGKLTAPDQLLAAIEEAGLKALDFSNGHAEAIRDFPDLRRHDPFDRMLLAQAKVENLTFLTSDRLLLDQSLGFVANARD